MQGASTQLSQTLLQTRDTLPERTGGIMKRSKGKGKPTRNFSQRLQHNLKRQTITQAQKANLVKLAKKGR